MVAFVTIIVGVLLIVLESVLLRIFGVRVYVPEVAVALVLYVALRREFTVGASSTLVFTAVADLCWGGPRGYYILGLTITFFVASAIRLRWKPRQALTLALLCIPATVLTDFIALGSLAIFRKGIAPLKALLAVSPITSVLTAVVALPVFWVFIRLDRLREHRRTQAVKIETGGR